MSDAGTADVTLNESTAAKLREWADHLARSGIVPSRVELIRLAADGLEAELWWRQRHADDTRRLDWLENHRADVFRTEGLHAATVMRPILRPDGLRSYSRHDAATVRAAIDAAMADKSR